MENTTEFALENWWMMDVFAFRNKDITEFFIQAVENSEVSIITLDKYNLLLENYPSMEKYFRHVFEKAYGSVQMRMKFLYDFSREELYFHFQNRFPDFFQRVPQYLIASYLGFTPEYLSKLRKKKIS